MVIAPATVIVSISSGVFFDLVKGSPFGIDHVERPGPVELQCPLISLGVRSRTMDVGRSRARERSCRVSRHSAIGRRERLGGIGFRFDMDQTPLSQEAKQTLRPGAQLERQSRLELVSPLRRPMTRDRIIAISTRLERERI